MYCLIICKDTQPDVRGYVDYSPEDILPEDWTIHRGLFTEQLLTGRNIHREDNSPDVETFDQFSQIYFNNVDKAIGDATQRNWLKEVCLMNIFIGSKCLYCKYSTWQKWSSCVRP